MTDDDPRPTSRTALRARPSQPAMHALEEAITRLNADGDFIARAMTESLLAARPISDEPTLSPEESDYLTSSGAFGAKKLQDTSAAVAKGSLTASAANTLLAGLHQSMSPAETRGFLKLTEDQLEELVMGGRLYAVEVAGEQRFPAWQFSLGSPGKLLPHLPEIIAILGEKHWISAAGLMSTPQSAMVAHGKQTPVEWFRGGGGIEALEKIVEAQKWR